MSSHKKIVGVVITIILLLVVIAGVFLIPGHRAAGKIPPSVQKEEREISKETPTQEKETQQRAQTTVAEHKDPSKKKGCVIFLHSGGFVVEKNEYHERFGAALGEALGYDYLVPDYPINKEYKETVAYMEPIYQQAMEEYNDVVIVGCSAGANLALATALAYGENYGMPKAFILMSPWLDTTLGNEEIQCVTSFDKEFYQNLIQWGKQYYGEDADSELASPIKAGKDQLAKLPQTVMVVGTQDILRYDAKLFYQELEDANVPVTYLDAEDKNHGEVFAEYASTYVMPEIMQQAIEHITTLQ